MKTSNMPMFVKTFVVGMNFKKWLQSPCGGTKGTTQADLLKHLKYWCADVSPSWDIPESAVDYCLGSVTVIPYFVGYLNKYRFLKSSRVTGYMNAPGHLLEATVI